MNPEKRPLNLLHDLREKSRLGSVALLMALGAADIATTYLGLQQGLSEGFPLTRHLMDNFGILGAIVVDSTAIASVLGASEAIHRLGNSYLPKKFGFAGANLALGIANIIAADNVINNLHLIT